MAFLLAAYFWLHALDNNLFQIPWQAPQPQLMPQHPQRPSEPFAALHSTVLGLMWAILTCKCLQPWHTLSASKLPLELPLLEIVYKQGLWRGVTMMHCRQRKGLRWLFIIHGFFYAFMRNSHEQSETETCSCVPLFCSCKGHAFHIPGPYGCQQDRTWELEHLYITILILAL